jgi:galactonate dehydratase
MAASLQVAGCTPNFMVLETMATDVPHRTEIAREQVRLVNGSLTIPDVPGLGVELDEAALVRYPFQPVVLRHYKGTLTDIRPPNAKQYLKGTNP